MKEKKPLLAQTPVVIGLQDCVGAPYHFTNTTANAANVLSALEDIEIHFIGEN